MALGFYFDVNKCIGCRTCHLACKDLHDLNLGPILRKVRGFEVGRYPDVSGYRYSGACYHCGVAVCMDACPTGALYRESDGTVQLDADRCIGCMVCAQSCPYGAPQLDEDRGVASKCDSCKHLRDAGGNPACVDSCLMRCLEFGDLDEFQQKHGPDLFTELPALPSAATTEPRVLIKPKPCALRTDFREVEI